METGLKMLIDHLGDRKSVKLEFGEVEVSLDRRPEKAVKLSVTDTRANMTTLFTLNEHGHIVTATQKIFGSTISYPLHFPEAYQGLYAFLSRPPFMKSSMDSPDVFSDKNQGQAA